MANEQNTQEQIFQSESDEDLPLKQKWRSIQAPATPENANSSFECNICLDEVQDPVVTLCGHLYCWPCIYKWLLVQRSAHQSDEEEPKCPVCKANVSQSSLVPLYGRGISRPEVDPKQPQPDAFIPRRPTAVASVTSHPSPQAYFHHPYSSYASAAPSNGGDVPTMTSFFRPMVGMFGEMVFTRMFRSPDNSLFSYPYSNTYSYAVVGSGSPRMRRQEMQVDESLNRVSIFLFCCFILCLILF